MLANRLSKEQETETNKNEKLTKKNDLERINSVDLKQDHCIEKISLLKRGYVTSCHTKTVR